MITEETLEGILQTIDELYNATCKRDLSSTTDLSISDILGWLDDIKYTIETAENALGGLKYNQDKS